MPLWYPLLISWNSVHHYNVQLKQTVSNHSITQTAKTLRHLHSSQKQKWKIKWAQTPVSSCSRGATHPASTQHAAISQRHCALPKQRKGKQTNVTNKHLLVLDPGTRIISGFSLESYILDRQATLEESRNSPPILLTPITWPPPSFPCGHFPEGQGKCDPLLHTGWWRYRGHTSPSGSPQLDN